MIWFDQNHNSTKKIDFDILSRKNVIRAVLWLAVVILVKHSFLPVLPVTVKPVTHAILIWFNSVCMTSQQKHVEHCRARTLGGNGRQCICAKSHTWFTTADDRKADSGGAGCTLCAGETEREGSTCVGFVNGLGAANIYICNQMGRVRSTCICDVENCTHPSVYIWRT